MRDLHMPSMEVTNLLNDWYLSIKFQNINEANRMKKAIEEKKDELKQDQRNMIYYMLLDFRHHLLHRQFDQAASSLTEIELEKSKMDGLLTYYYLFFRGHYEYNLGHYESAIEIYQLAEEVLKYVPDNTERAEFHYSVGAAYFQIDFLTLALQHAKEALKIFKAQSTQTIRMADCYNLLGAIHTELQNYPAAIEYNQKTKDFIDRLDYHHELKSMTRQNLGILYSKIGESDKAIEYLKLALQFSQRLNNKLKLYYLLAKECFKESQIAAGRKWLSEGMDLAVSNSENVFVHRFRVLEAFYLKREEIETIVPEAIAYFKKLKLWDYVEGYSLDLAEYYREAGRHKEASEWLLAVARSRKRFSTK
ncbi:tetratricopeptide repeat protein [Camelliibacillus cellulosilyticus]|uniref:Tetratricopeptide repeat protein n=1 Tax=Camelliibacillus cellulosilyticus TaxID=2174486 RepID=A0ABV9GNN2_9BACL